MLKSVGVMSRRPNININIINNILVISSHRYFNINPELSSVINTASINY
jgi:hypothetical protein